MLSNPPFGVTWGGKDGYEKEARKLEKTRYQAGMPRVNDGALLFLQTMLAKMQPPEKGGSRIAIIFNGSPLSNGDCGSGESEIRRWILENDWLDAIVMLPDQLFYNTGIFTYIWLLRNEKPADHRGRVMLIDARQQFEKEPKSFGNKRNRMTDAHRQWIEERYRDGWAKGYADEQVKIFRREDFAYHKVKVVFWQTDEHDQPAIITEPYEKAFTAANLTKEQAFHDSDLTFRVRVKADNKEKTVEFVLKPADSAAKKFKAALGDRPEILSVEWTHRHYVQDDEYIPHGEDIEAFLKREIAKPIIRWAGQPATRLRNPAEQILLPLPAAHARERFARGVLEAGEGGGEDAGGTGAMKKRKRPGRDDLAGIPAVHRGSEGAGGFRPHLGGAGREPRPDPALLGHRARDRGEATDARLGGVGGGNGCGGLAAGVSRMTRLFTAQCVGDAPVLSQPTRTPDFSHRLCEKSITVTSKFCDRRSQNLAETKLGHKLRPN